MKTPPPIIFICNNLFIPSLYSLRKVSVNFAFYRNEQSICERVIDILKMEKVDSSLYSKSIIKTLCEFYRFDLRAILNYLQMILQKPNLSKETFLSELKHDLGEQVSYFDVMDRLFFKGKNNFWSNKIEDFKEYSRLRLLTDGRFSQRMKHLHSSYFRSNSRKSFNNPYKSKSIIIPEYKKRSEKRRE
jgi:hypothetical protein